ncbi:MAG: rhomboid family intramembrane serine protease [Clostridia bacterium]|nr:rhomboid family intramembrane serine protease [Clostridia bacterium]
MLINVILYAALGSQWRIDTKDFDNYGHYVYHWEQVLYFRNLIQTFLSAFSHFNWQHTLLNMLCFFICGLYLERKLGSIKFLLLIICFAFFGGCAVAANHNSINSYGFSGVNYAIYAYILIDYLFWVIPKERRNKLNIISGAVMLALIYFAACFNGGTEQVSFSWYPYDALHNLGHYTSYLVGLIIATLLCANEYRIERKLNEYKKQLQ